MGAPNTDSPTLKLEVPNEPEGGSVVPNPNLLTELVAEEKLGPTNPDPNTLPPGVLGCLVFSFSKIRVLVCPNI